MRRLSLLPLGLLAALVSSLGCNGDKTTTTDDETTGSSTGDASTGSTTGEPTTTSTTGEPTTTTSTTSTTSTTTGGDTAADGEPCNSNGDCMSLACVKFTDFQTDAVCEAGPDGGNTRFTGTIFNFVTGAPIPMADLRVVGALSALQDPEGATGLVTATSDAMGRIDATTTMPLNQGIGVVGLVGGGEIYITATGLAAPLMGTTYGPLNGIHDIWGVPTATLTEWTGFLMADADPNVVAALPLGDNGGVIGLVRDGTGAGVAGAVVKSMDPDTDSIVRYLNDDMKGFNPDMTGATGIFVLLAPGLAEDFTVDINGAPSGLTGTAGSAAKAAFVLIFNAP